MKLLGARCFLLNLIFLFTLASHVDGKVAQSDVGREVAPYYFSYIQEPCEQNRVISAGQDGLSRYGFIMADTDGCIDAYKDCSIYLNVSAGYYITMRIQYLSFDCTSTLEITGETGQPTSFCGYYTPSYSIYSTSNWLRYRFITANVPNCQSGFSFYYTAYHITDECSADEFRCEYDGRCIPIEVVCDMYDNCGDWSDERTDVCGGRPTYCNTTSYYGPSGVISSPNYPDNYPNYFSCDYYVNASSSSSSIAIIFKAFDTEECCDNVTISCAANPIYPSVRYSGSSLPQPFSIPWCSEAVINFVTNSATVSTGFSLDYHISLGGCGDTVYTGSHGYVSSPNYPNGYDSNQNCSNIICSSQKSSFAIIFQYMNVEECCDFVELSCLDNAEFGSHRFTGTSIPTKLEIPFCTQVLVWFYSDDTVAQDGFNLEYIATPDPDNH